MSALPSARLWRLTLADFIVRLAYQMGKTPILPLFAASLAASETLIGIIIAISTGTGLVLKPLFGFLSDRTSRRYWLLVSVALFTFVPFFYLLVETPAQLVALRVFHGVSTAIFGPVSLAVVISMDRRDIDPDTLGRAERLGWFGMARTAGYLIAPTLAVVLLDFVAIEQVFVIIGAFSSLAFIPLAFEPRENQSNLAAINRSGAENLAPTASSFLGSMFAAFATVLRTPAIWMAGMLDFGVYLSTYALKAFLPLYALSVGGISLLSVGLFFTVQEATHLVVRPLGGRMADRLGFVMMVGVGMFLLSAGLAVVSLTGDSFILMLAAVLTGLAMALVFPATTALAGRGIDMRNTGVGMGFLGTMRNLGKIGGPVIIGVLLNWYEYGSLFQFLAVVSLAAALLLLSYSIRRGAPRSRIG